MSTTKTKLKCKCGKLAVWDYAPSDAVAYYCEDCVPRGCSCNYDDETDTMETDDQGRELPCCEYFYNEKGHESYDDDDPLP